jgi:hypothetical protein
MNRANPAVRLGQPFLARVSECLDPAADVERRVWRLRIDAIDDERKCLEKIEVAAICDAGVRIRVAPSAALPETAQPAR